ncbi:TolC family protein [Flavobacterium sp. SUN046]|uniref:TolC family protein n=1 Tax=Flavobacterium sp. SUN046 TaxID=3002440 RepID=UPI002DBCA862|nr:TolC family protein [Flavobacterium sp. SUN046]MEC4050268.1 TolC family protein [Flavobacterium sp. SUN046]
MKTKIILTLLLFTGILFAQSPMSLQDCENQFLKNNLYLLANHYNIDAAQAQVLQAKIWDNPSFGFELNAWSPNSEKKYFNAGSDGEKSGYIQQLIHIGGQRKNQIELAKTNTKIAELDFNMLLRDLKFQLRQNFFAIYYDTKSITEIDKQIVSLRTLIDAYSVQTNKGNVALKDLVRLQNLFLSLQTDRNELMNDIIENKKNLETLISSEKNIDVVPAPTTEEIAIYQKPITTKIEELQKTAIENRPDLQKAEKIIEANNWNLKYQKSLSIPDLTLGASYDQRGGAFNNQTDLTIGLPLPLWNKNKGNIKIAKLLINQADAQKKQQIVEINNDVKSAYLKYVEQKNSFDIVKSPIPEDLQTVYQGVYNNFAKRNISMLEFTDFLESYNQSIISLNKIYKSYIIACEEINYSTASKLF